MVLMHYHRKRKGNLKLTGKVEGYVSRLSKGRLCNLQGTAKVITLELSG